MVLHIGDYSEIPTYARANYGILEGVIMCKSITCALISVSYITKTLNLFVFYSYDRAFVLQQTTNDSATEPNLIYRTIASATLQSDMLFHIDDMRAFLHPLHVSSSHEHEHKQVPQAHYSFSDQPYTEREIKYGGARVFIKSCRQYLSLLQWLHVRLGHANEALIHWMIDKDIVLGSGVSKTDLAKLKLGVCGICYRARMHAFAMPPSISHKVYLRRPHAFQ